LRGFFGPDFREEFFSRNAAKAWSKDLIGAAKMAVSDFLLDDPLLFGFEFDGHG
jgi:hypothetical protein